MRLLDAQLLRSLAAGNDEAPTIEALGEQGEAGAIPVHLLEVAAAPVDEHEQAAGQRVLGHRVAHHADQAVAALAHVHGLAPGENARRNRAQMHQRPPRKR